MVPVSEEVGYNNMIPVPTNTDDWDPLEDIYISLFFIGQEAEEESEVMVDIFMANGGSLEEFLEQYKEKRKLAHMRRIKIDKMRELIAAKKVTR